MRRSNRNRKNATVHPARAAVVGMVVTVAMVVLTAPVAGAHGATGTMTITKAEAAGPDRIVVQVGIVYSNDSELADEATVSATLTGPAAATVGPVALTRDQPNSSLYSAEIAVPSPGEWSVAVTSTEPSASATAAVTVGAAATSSIGLATTTSAAVTTAPPASGSTVVTASSPSDAGGGGLSTVLVIGVVLVVAAAAVVGFVVARRRGSA